jgi:hypothetical protein
MNSICQSFTTLAMTDLNATLAVRTNQEHESKSIYLYTYIIIFLFLRLKGRDAIKGSGPEDPIPDREFFALGI